MNWDRMRTKLLAAALVAAFAAGTAIAGSTPMSRADYEGALERIDADYKATLDRCKATKGNAKDICQAEAKGAKNTARAELEADFRGTEKARRGAVVARAEAQFNVAREKCDDRPGAERGACVREARATQSRMLAEMSAKPKK